MLACVDGYQPSPDPCGCPTCARPDAAVVKDAGRADTQPPVCPMLASLNATDADHIGYSAERMLIECQGGGISGICVSNDVTGCSGSGSVVGGPVNCNNTCAANEYGLGYGGVGPLAAPPSIDLPAGCRLGLQTPGGVAFYCCPCGL
jgi:hypothetical protein